MRPPEFWSRDSLSARLTARALAPIGYLYGASVAWKFRRQEPYRSRAKVVCVGNLTAGGSGKTPIAIAVAQLLQAKGLAVVFLSRGYGRHSSGVLRVDAQNHNALAVGDEPLLLTRIAPTVVAGDRAEGARLAERCGAEVIVMDDGHQNFSLTKDLSLVVVDGDTGFGNGGVIPAGPLREPVQQGLERTDAVIVSGVGMPSLSGFTGPLLRARIVPDRRLDGQRVIAFAGIGHPNKFFAALSAQGAELLEARTFADHHQYSTGEIAALRDRARGLGARLITTEKDYVRLSAADRSDINVLPVHAVFDDQPALEQLLAPVLDRSVANP
jgi:tetraacyldisaccharide 4'-kinase